MPLHTCLPGSFPRCWLLHTCGLRLILPFTTAVPHLFCLRSDSVRSAALPATGCSTTTRFTPRWIACYHSAYYTAFTVLPLDHRGTTTVYVLPPLKALVGGASCHTTTIPSYLRATYHHHALPRSQPLCFSLCHRCVLLVLVVWFCGGYATSAAIPPP